MTEKCDHKSVGVIIKNEAGKMALLKRARFPIGISPPAGHVDSHGSLEQAAIDETQEELGLILTLESLKEVIHERRVDNSCRREDGDYHIWNVYEASTTHATLVPDPDETAGGAWYSPSAVQSFADRTQSYLQGRIPAEEWAAEPGIEPVWLNFLVELGHVAAS
jgi:8-oxo-dGTP pyrophosphatase MutT (NUDIX family)